MSKSTCKKENKKKPVAGKNKQPKQDAVHLPVIRPNAAGIDIGDTLHAVAVPVGRDKELVKKFGAFTCDLLAIVLWLKQCGIDTIAMESTGVYWKPLFALLIAEGFEVYLVNAKQTKNVSGRKTDMSDASWIQMLHSCGLLKSSFLPDDRTETLRTLVRQRKALTQDSSRCIQRIQKNFELMNLKIHTVIADITGKTGKAIIEAIIQGERKASNFLPLIDGRIQASEQEILKSLEGNWRTECLFLVKQCYSQYNQLQAHIADCEKEIEEMLQQMAAAANEGVIEIPTGTDLSRWETSNHFVSWLNLCPNNKITGGKLVSSKIMKKTPNNAAQAFRAAANGLRRTENWLGDYFRRMRAKGGQKFAIVATARKLAIIYYRMVRYKEAFIEVDMEVYKEKHRKSKIAYLEKKLAELRKEAA